MLIFTTVLNQVINEAPTLQQTLDFSGIEENFTEEAQEEEFAGVTGVSFDLALFFFLDLEGKMSLNGCGIHER